ncbi:hypothetical protein, partial [Pricia sp.]|uniref:hypothetical protein n=1 Tax=Pricia sp. TaxID=2268138 RepID=UPI0035937902
YIYRRINILSKNRFFVIRPLVPYYISLKDNPKIGVCPKVKWYHKSLNLDIDSLGQVPSEVEKPPPTIPTERATCARPLSAGFSSTAFQPPLSRAKEQAAKRPLDLSSP